MDRNTEMPKAALATALVVPLALMIGVLLVNPLAPTTIGLVGLVLLGLMFPLLVRWHHPLLIVFWNAAFLAFFLPGRPAVWVALAAMSFGLAVLSRAVSFRAKFLQVRSVTVALVLLGLVVVVTMVARGEIGRAHV